MGMEGNEGRDDPGYETVSPALQGDLFGGFMLPPMEDRTVTIKNLIERAAEQLPLQAVVWRDDAEDEDEQTQAVMSEIDSRVDAVLADAELPDVISEDEAERLHLSFLQMHEHLLRDKRTRPETKLQIIEWVLEDIVEPDQVMPFSFQACALFANYEPETARWMFLRKIRRHPDIGLDSLRQQPFRLTTAEMKRIVVVLRKAGLYSRVNDPDEIVSLVRQVIIKH